MGSQLFSVQTGSSGSGAVPLCHSSSPLYIAFQEISIVLIFLSARSTFFDIKITPQRQKSHGKSWGVETHGISQCQLPVLEYLFQSFIILRLTIQVTQSSSEQSPAFVSWTQQKRKTSKGPCRLLVWNSLFWELVVVLGIKCKASFMYGKSSAVELHPQVSEQKFLDHNVHGKSKSPVLQRTVEDDHVESIIIHNRNASRSSMQSLRVTELS